MKKEDLFITDARLEPLLSFDMDDTQIQNWDDADYAEVNEYVNQLNRKG
jgi:hypothetical protein